MRRAGAALGKQQVSNYQGPLLGVMDTPNHLCSDLELDTPGPGALVYSAIQEVFGNRTPPQLASPCHIGRGGRLVRPRRSTTRM